MRSDPEPVQTIDRSRGIFPDPRDLGAQMGSEKSRNQGDSDRLSLAGDRSCCLALRHLVERERAPLTSRGTNPSPGTKLKICSHFPFLHVVTLHIYFFLDYCLTSPWPGRARRPELSANKRGRCVLTGRVCNSTQRGRQRIVSQPSRKCGSFQLDPSAVG